MLKYYVFFFSAVVCTSCNSGSKTKSQLEGHTYMVKPLTSIMELKEMMTLHSTVHHYLNSNEVEVTEYVAKEPIKTQVMSYSIVDSTYDIEGERYTIRKDTGNGYTLSVNNTPTIKLKFVK